MGLFNLGKRKPKKPSLMRYPSGSFTVNAEGGLISSTLPSDFSSEIISMLGNDVITSFQSAAGADSPLTELKMDYAGLKLTARELRGGAIIFITPKSWASRT
jgi:hypothetical protein